MAEGVCADGMANSVKDSVVEQAVDLLSISHKDCLNAEAMKSSSFYIHEDGEDMFGINGVVGLGVHASAMLCDAASSDDFCPDNGDSCRKKRCADRYDSSESSDSGVATLSCTDCSTSSITDPGSPYSTASTHSSTSEVSDDCSPRKNAQSRHWTTERDKGPPPPPPPLPPITAQKTAPNKRLKVEVKVTSPILSVPTTIRFPANASDSDAKPSSSQSESPDSIICRWSECETHFDTNTGLLEHLQAKHVNTQVQCENFVCLWVGCKVYARTSCSRSWLERHVLSHGGNKPFRCIVDGCGQLFSSQTALERHVNGHFQNETGNGNAGARRSLESASSKLFRRNGKKLRYRRQPWSARMFDYFDSGIMEGLQHRLVSMTEVRTQGNVATAAGNTVSLHGKVMARRIEPNGRIQVLLRWYPEDILPDEWVAETEACTSRSVPIPSLPPAAMTSLQTTLFVPGRNKQRRKPVKCT